MASIACLYTVPACVDESDAGWQAVPDKLLGRMRAASRVALGRSQALSQDDSRLKRVDDLDPMRVELRRPLRHLLEDVLHLRLLQHAFFHQAIKKSSNDAAI